MKIIPAALLLENFGAAFPAAPAVTDVPRDERAYSEPDVTEDIGERLKLAFEEGREKGRREGLAQSEEDMARLQQTLEQKCAARERQYKAEIAGALTQNLQEGITRLETAIGDAVRDVLAPFAAHMAVTAAVEELSSRLANLLSVDGDLQVRVKGDAGLLEALRQRLGGYSGNIHMEEAQTGCGLLVQVDNTILETTIHDWAEDALAGKTP
jgi:hypothetical protein